MALNQDQLPFLFLIAFQSLKSLLHETYKPASLLAIPFFCCHIPVAPTIKKTFPGDQWVTAAIEVKNGKIVHYVNGEKILQFEDPRYDSAHAIGKTFIVGSNDVVKDGYISIQSNSHPMDFRKIDIMVY